MKSKNPWELIKGLSLGRTKNKNEYLQEVSKENSSEKWGLSPEGRLLVWGKLDLAEVGRHTTFEFYDLQEDILPKAKIPELYAWKSSPFDRLGGEKPLVVSAHPESNRAVLSNLEPGNPELMVFNTGTGQQLGNLESHMKAPASLLFSEDGLWVVSGGNDTRIVLWDLSTFMAQEVVQLRNGYFNIISLTDDHREVIINRSLGGYEKYDLRSGKLSESFQRSEVIPEEFITFLDGGRRLLSKSASELCIFDIQNASLEARFIGHTDVIQTYAVSEARGLAMTAQWVGDSTIFVWNLMSGDKIAELEGHLGQVRALAVSADGRYLLSGGRDSTLRVWDIDALRCVEVRQMGSLVERITPLNINGLFLAVLEDHSVLLQFQPEGTMGKKVIDR